MSALSGNLIVPAILLAALGWSVPRLLALVFPEGVKPLLALAFSATLIMVVVAMAFFLALYVMQGMTMAQFFGLGLWDGLWHLGRLGLVSALIWGPILVLSVAGLPKHWVEETW